MNIPLKRYGALLAKYLRHQRRKALLLCALLAGTIAMQLANPQILRYFIDLAMGNGSPSALVVAGILFLGVGLLTQLFSVAATYVGADVGWTATNMLREDLAAHCLSLDMPFHNQRTPGELIERIDGDITALANFFSQFVVRVLGSAILVLGILLLIFRENWQAGIALSLYVCGAGYILHRFSGIAVNASAEEREASATLLGFVEERLSGLDDIRANGAGAYVIHRFQKALRNMFRHGRHAWVMRSHLWTVIITLFTIADILALGIGIYLYRLDIVTLGVVYLFFQYTQMLWGTVEQLTQQLQDLQKASASIGRIEELLAVKHVMQDGEGIEIPAGSLAVEFDDVTFAYGETQAILSDVSFKLEAGAVLGLLGRTGSGKTTITRLLFRLYDPESGAISLNGIDIRRAHQTQLRGRVAMVTQEVQLFHATVRDNLTFFDRQIPDQRIMGVIERLGLTDWYASMPQGIDTMLTAGGGGLSAGEAQLLAFTRVFLQDPGLVILDEPSSRMDRATERLLENAMHRLLENRTAIIIAHRLSTVARADQIMVMEHGRILEHGPREQLATTPGTRFHRLLQAGLEVAAS